MIHVYLYMGRNRWDPHVIPIYKAAIKNINCSGTVIPEGCHITANREKSVLIIAGTDLTLAFVELIYNSDDS